MAAREGELLWEPSGPSKLSRYMEARGYSDYNELWRWSVTDLEGFWRSIWELYELGPAPERVLERSAMPGARWFPGTQLNYAERVFRNVRAGETAVVHASESAPLAELSWDELRDQTARCAAGLRRLGVGRGDRVVAYMPNVPETLVAFLATASIGAIWSSCAPEFGTPTVVDRFRQIEPKVLIATEGYRYGGRDFDRRERVAEIEAAIPSLEHTVMVPSGWDDLLSEPAELSFEQRALRPSAVGAVLVGDDRPAEGDRPGPRRHPARAPEEAEPALGPLARPTASSGSRRPAG